MNTFKLDNKEQTSEVKWAMLAASKDKARAILNGLYIHNGKTVGVDGFRMHIINTPEPLVDSIAVQGKVIQPTNTINLTPRIEEYEVVDGTFPDYEQIIPTSPPVFKIAIDKKLLADLKTMPGDKAVVLSFTAANQPVLVTCPGSEASAVIMPMTLSEYTNIDAAE